MSDLDCIVKDFRNSFHNLSKKQQTDLMIDFFTGINIASSDMLKALKDDRFKDLMVNNLPDIVDHEVFKTVIKIIPDICDAAKITKSDICDLNVEDYHTRPLIYNLRNSFKFIYNTINKIILMMPDSMSSNIVTVDFKRKKK